MKRLMAIWFPQLLAEGMLRRRPHLKDELFVVAAPDHGRMRITAVCPAAQKQGIAVGMAVADARALVGNIQVLDDEPQLPLQLLTGLGHWCIRYTPTVATDLPDGLLLDVSGCAHLWGGEEKYATDIQNRLKGFGYTTRIAIAGTIGTAWALARYGKQSIVLAPSGEERSTLMSLPPAALRLETAAIERLQKLGLYTIGHFINMGRSILRRRFGAGLLDRMDQAFGWKEEPFTPLTACRTFPGTLTLLGTDCYAGRY